MKPQALAKAAAASADPHRAGQYLEQLNSSAAGAFLRKLTAAQSRILAAVLAGSAAMSETLVAHPDWLKWLLEPGFLDHPRQDQGLRREVNKWLDADLERGGHEEALERLREFKQREMLRIGARDLARLGGVAEITREISNVADVCLQAVFRVCRRRLGARLGEPFHLDIQDRWTPTPFCVLGLGKLGGQELNYSSDVDVIFIYAQEGHLFKSPPRPGEDAGKGLGNHAFFQRLGEAMVAEIARMTAGGMLFRIDMRLRPEGPAGPLSRSLPSYENYYAQWGQTWERMMLIKARPVAGDLELGAEFIETVHPFRYPQSLSERTLGEIAAMKRRTENEVVKAGEIDRNVKLGRGGIREIEFIVQTLQLTRAGKMPFLQTGSTLAALNRLAQYGALAADDASALDRAYVFLRDVEHRLQMEAAQQTHTIPTERQARDRLARLMGFDTLAAFEAARKRHSAEVRRIYDQILAGKEPPETDRPAEIEGSEERWKKILAEHSFVDVDQALKMASQFLNGPGYSHVSPRTTELARELWGRFLALCPARGKSAPTRGDAHVLSDPDRALVRLDSFVEAYGARATLFELWTHNPSLFDLLLLLFDRSEFLAERAIRAPDLVDELETSGRLRRTKTAEETLADLRHGARDKDQILWLRRYHEAELMRLGLRDILGLADFEKNLEELSALADASLQYALESVCRQHGLKEPPFCVIGLGKLGGREINYGSDLDVLFVTDALAKALPPLQRLATDVIELLAAKTEHGSVFAIDARLRPDGEKGLLVNNLDAHEEYYRRRAALWEIQALTRARPVAGKKDVGARFQRVAAALADFTPENVQAGFPGDGKNSTGLRAYTPGWKRELDDMRQRTVKERTPAGQEALAIKTGVGGLMDAEFLAQAFSLEMGLNEPNTLQALQRGLERAPLSKADGATLIDNYKKLRRIEGILRRWSFEGETVLPDDPAPLYRVARRCGYPSAEKFMEALGSIRRAIHAGYVKYFGAARH